MENILLHSLLENKGEKVLKMFNEFLERYPVVDSFTYLERYNGFIEKLLVCYADNDASRIDKNEEKSELMSFMLDIKRLFRELYAEKLDLK